MKKIRRALISVSDKKGLEELGKTLQGLGIEILSTGGTARELSGRGIPVREVSQFTGFPEMLDGRVKTLHPKVHGGILARRANKEHARAVKNYGLEYIDMVVVNLYPFETAAAKPDVSEEELIENIDIGGPTMIRAAAKNFEDVAVVVSPDDYSTLIGELRANQGSLPRETRFRLARTAFAHTAAYDAAISTTLDRRAAPAGETTLPERIHLSYRKVTDLRYGENPHQKAALYGPLSGARARGVAFASQLQGKELSFNNLVDLQAAWNLVMEFDHPTTIIVKHTNPCGVASGTTLAESYRRALEVDPVSAFGSVIAFNRSVDLETAEELARLFIEVGVAPRYSPEARERLARKKNLRLMEMSSDSAPQEGLEARKIGDALLIQTEDRLLALPEGWKSVTARKPSPTELQALLFAWRVAKHVKSNAIVFSRENQVVGVGAGQMSRVDAAKVAIMKARDLNHSLNGTVVASDAFFPFPDGVEVAAKAGATAIVQPGGSKRDSEVIQAADRLGVAMMLTGVRHFRH